MELRKAYEGPFNYAVSTDLSRPSEKLHYRPTHLGAGAKEACVIKHHTHHSIQR